VGCRGSVLSLCATSGFLVACASHAPSSTPNTFANLNDAGMVLVSGGGFPSATYAVALYPSGVVEFCGVMNVEAIGERHGLVSIERVEALMSRAKSSGFFNLSDEYIGPVLHAGTVELSIAERPGKLKSVFESAGDLIGMPGIVIDLTAEINKIADDNGWLGQSTYNVPDFPECGKKFGLRPPEIVKPIFR
jgi:hypothetical protein